MQVATPPTDCTVQRKDDPDRKSTRPEGGAPPTVTLAVRLTFWPGFDGFWEEATAMLGVPLLTPIEAELEPNPGAVALSVATIFGDVLVAVVGVPLRTPAVLSERPGGSAAPFENAYGGVPPEADSVTLYGTPTVADGKLAGATVMAEPAAGVTEFEGAEAGPVPAAVTALTVNVYAMPLVRPVITRVVAAVPPLLSAPPAGTAVTA